MIWVLLKFDGFDIFTKHSNFVFFSRSVICYVRLITNYITQNSEVGLLPIGVQSHLRRYRGHRDSLDGLDRALIAIGYIRRLVRISVVPPKSHDELVWPSTMELVALLENNGEPWFSSFICNEDNSLRGNAEGAAWNSDVAENMQLQLCMIARTGAVGRRGYKFSLRTLLNHFVWSKNQDDMPIFVRTCVLCLSAVGVGEGKRRFFLVSHLTVRRRTTSFNWIRSN